MTINDVAARVSRLEGRISEISNPSSGTALSYPTDNPVTPLSHEDLAAESSVEEHSSAEDHLVENGDSSHYVNEVLFSRILDEVKTISLSLLFMLTSHSAGTRSSVGYGKPKG
jgi:hypothetical protein